MFSMSTANQKASRSTEHGIRTGRHRGFTLLELMIVLTLIGLIILVLRVFEFRAMDVSFRDNAYGSIVYAVLALHTAHLLTDFIDSCVLTVLMFTKHAEGRRFVDVSENAFYWYFVVLVWLPIYVPIYWVPRLG